MQPHADHEAADLAAELTKSVEQFAKVKGFDIVRPKKDQRSSNKFLGQDKPKSKINAYGYDPVKRAADIAKAEVQARLDAVMQRRVQSGSE